MLMVVLFDVRAAPVDDEDEGQAESKIPTKARTHFYGSAYLSGLRSCPWPCRPLMASQGAHGHSYKYSITQNSQQIGHFTVFTSYNSLKALSRGGADFLICQIEPFHRALALARSPALDRGLVWPAIRLFTWGPVVLKATHATRQLRDNLSLLASLQERF